ncbi:hypothetical protein ABZ568_00350 [Streptomyces olindensis]|uniref:Uncharacterized protein n=1 Tax=Streptomyces olindensis TaxID=358823 RepID=A0ABV2XLR7_9ACTN
MSSPTPDDLTSYYVLYEDGSVGLVQVTAGAPEPVLSKPGRLVDQAEYEAKLSQIKAAEAQRQADAKAAETAQKKDAYDALVAANFDPAVATTLTGYTPPPQIEEAS